MGKATMKCICTMYYVLYYIYLVHPALFLLLAFSQSQRFLFRPKKTVSKNFLIFHTMYHSRVKCSEHACPRSNPPRNAPLDLFLLSAPASWPLPAKLDQVLINGSPCNAAGVRCSAYSRQNTNEVFKNRCRESSWAYSPLLLITQTFCQCFMPMRRKMRFRNNLEKCPALTMPVNL